MAKKKVTRKDLLNKPDEFITYSQRLLNWAGDHRKTLSIGGAAVILLLVAVAAHSYFAEKAEKRAATLLNATLISYRSELEASGPEKAYEKTAQDFESLIDRYGSNDAGKQAKVFFGDICYAGKAYDRAAQFYRSALNDYAHEPFMHDLITVALGHALSEAGKYAEALQSFEKVASVSGEQALKAEALFNVAELDAREGQKEKSTEAFNRLAAEYPDTLFGALALERSTVK